MVVVVVVCVCVHFRDDAIKKAKEDFGRFQDEVKRERKIEERHHQARTHYEDQCAELRAIHQSLELSLFDPNTAQVPDHTPFQRN